MLHFLGGLARRAGILLYCALVLSGGTVLAGSGVLRADGEFRIWDGGNHRGAEDTGGSYQFKTFSGMARPFDVGLAKREVASESNGRAGEGVIREWVTWDGGDIEIADDEWTFEAPGMVLRGQSPEVSLLPLASGTTPIESTNYLTPLILGNGRLRGDYVTDLDETSKIGAQILTQGGLGLGVDAEVNYWQRPVANLGWEALWTGDVNMMYGLSPISRFKLRSGVGANWMVDGGDAHYGYNFTHGVDIYLLWRGMFTGEIDWGEIDGDKLFRYRLGLGLTVKSFDLFTGFESQRIGNERLDGWMNGVAIWY